MRWIRVLVPSAAALWLCLPVTCQEVISAYAGTVHYFEGGVFLDNQALEHKPAVFPAIQNGSTLRTEQGRAEVLLTPGVVLRMDEDSSIRMVSNSLTDTRVEFLKGAAIVDTLAASGTPPVVLTYQQCQIRFPKAGIYRIDSDTSVLQAYVGEAKVAGTEGKTSSVDTSKLFFFDLGTTTNKFGEPNEDSFYDWSRGRADALSAENQLAEQSADSAAAADNSPYIWNTPIPYSGSYPTYSIFDGTYLAGSAFNPFFGFGAGGFAPFGVWPVVVLERRRPGTYQHWPHRPPSMPVLTSTHSGYRPSPVRGPVLQPRPLPSAGIRTPRVGAAPPPHPVAPAAVRPLIHR